MMTRYIWALVDISSMIIFQFLGVIILSRMLTPEDYGVIGMMTIFISVGNLLVDSGMGGALIKKQTPTDTDYHTLFCFNLIVSIIFYSLLFVGSDAISKFYSTPILSNCIRVYGLFIILSSLGIVQNTRLVKELRYKELAIITIIASILGLLVAILLARKGHGFWALIIQQLVYISVRVGLQSIINKFRPKFIFSKVSFKEQFSFGGSILLSNIVNTIYSNITSSIIPKIGSVYQNGLYAQATKIQQVPLSIIISFSDKVLFPVLSKSANHQELIQKTKKLFRHLLPLIFIIICSCTFLSKSIVLILLGNGWREVTEYLQILFLGGFGTCYQYVACNVFKTYGKTGIILKCTTLKSLVGISVILISTPFGITYLLWGNVLSTIITSIINSYFLAKSCNYSYKEQIKDIWLSLAIAILCITIFLTKNFINLP